MRIAIISDIHGNLIALNAVLDDLAREPLDQIICLGDVASFGPQPAEVVARLRAAGCPVVMGNADAELLTPGAPAADETLRRLQEIDVWCAAQLSTADRAYISSFQPTISVTLDTGASLLCYHGSPQSFNDPIRTTTSDDDLARYFSGFSAQLFAGGHTHIQMLRRYRDALVLNPGSVGLAYDRVPSPGVADATVRNPPWAEYAILTVAGGRLGVDLRRVPFDVAALLRAARASGMPHAAWWCADWDTA
ncbi:MAG: Diadenosine tetraphosphatase related serine/threonine protein phosphatase [Ktedonobacterales bacterium]|jgi:predicted phosphodiesterase|nr:MAG: Diadenosine tetraphosphatase related serine/threonine protein phosphatase [Ktedonobacterales bacterium]